MLLLRCS
jgi:ATP-binding dynein motor region